jgi:hypothetical protein
MLETKVSQNFYKINWNKKDKELIGLKNYFKIVKFNKIKFKKF